MAIPIAALRAKYIELADQFITDINNTDVVLYYAKPIVDAVAGSFDDKPKFIDEYGGRQPLDNMNDRHYETGENYQANTLSETIKARVYWLNRAFDKDTKTYSEIDVCKVITYATLASKLTEAQSALISGRKVKLTQPPIEYGLFGAKQYCISFWTAI
jgi:hypothetical protein